MCLAEMTVYVNQSLPEDEEFYTNRWLMGIWGIMSVSAIVLHINLMMIASIIHIAVLQISVHEGPEDTLSSNTDQYRLDGSNPEGIVMHPQQVGCSALCERCVPRGATRLCAKRMCTLADQRELDGSNPHDALIAKKMA